MEVQIQTWRRVLLFMYANSSSGGVLPPLSYSYPQRNQTFSSHTEEEKKRFQSHQSEKLSNIILFIQDNFILLSMHKMLEKKMRTFTHSPWILLFSTSRFSASFCPILSGFRKQQLFLHMTSLKNPDNNVEYSQHMVNVSTFFQVIHHVDLFFVIPRSMPLEHSLRKLSCKAWLFYI